MATAAANHRISLDRHSTGMVLTPREFDSIEDYDENYHYELINGVVVVNPIPGEYETGPNELLAYYLLDYQNRHPQGSALDCTLPQQYVQTRLSRRVADRLIWTGLGRLPDVQNDIPSIAVEFVSKRKRDRDRDYIHKKRDYAKAGIKEYWIIDRFRRTMTVVKYQPKGSKEQVVEEPDTYKTAILPGFELHLARILESADKLEQARRSRSTR